MSVRAKSVSSPSSSRSSVSSTSLPPDNALHPLLARSRQFAAAQGPPPRSYRSSYRSGNTSDYEDDDSNGDENAHFYPKRKQDKQCHGIFRRLQHKLETSEHLRLSFILFGCLMLLGALLNSNAAFHASRLASSPSATAGSSSVESALMLADVSSKPIASSHSNDKKAAGVVDDEPSSGDGTGTEKHMLDTLANLGLLDSKHSSSTVGSVMSMVKDADTTSGGGDLNAGVAPPDVVPLHPVPMREAKDTVAYVITLLECNDDDNSLDGAAVLARSIILNSVANPKSPSKYHYKLYAIVHTTALPLEHVPKDANSTHYKGDGTPTGTCLDKLELLGYNIIIKDHPVQNHEIAKEGYLKQNLGKTIRDYIKLYTYSLVDHNIAVHMDLTSIVLHPLDELFDAMLEPIGTPAATEARSLILHHKPDNATRQEPLPEIIDAFYTRDYTTLQPSKTSHIKAAGLQQGLLVVRPSQKVFDDLVSIVQAGEFSRHKGWADTGHGSYLGAMSTKGLLSYYYHHLQNSTNSVELNRCFYNNMADTPRTKGTDGAMVCRDGRNACQDCRTADIRRIRTANVAICRKPWKCFYHDVAITQTFLLCRELERTWFHFRHNLEDMWAATLDDYAPADRSGAFAVYEFRGNCHNGGETGYNSIIYP